ncbi:MAG TPA: glycerophosphodiester phosphodiesterase [Candidatus Faecaligallichristensenella faecipullorum]|nr:glycerophosphodiester phosphodiesterase [Candidatus Faecaligallichristensenella faecipullorum]
MSLKPKTLITAHAGAEGTVPNTLESIRALAECGAEMIEVDVRGQDGQLILTHNEPEPGVRYPTLEDCFREALLHEGLRVNVDLKAPGLVRAAAELAARCGFEGRYLITGSVSDPEIPWALEQGVTVWYNEEQLSDRAHPFAGLSEKGFSVLNMDYARVTEELLAQSPERLSLWTVSEEQAIARFLRAGVKNITSRTPRLALRLRKEIQG